MASSPLPIDFCVRMSHGKPMGGILGDIADAVVKGLFGLLTSYMEKRGLLQQGRELQKQADLQSSVQEGKDASKIDESVSRDSDKQLNDALEQLRNTPAGHA